MRINTIIILEQVADDVISTRSFTKDEAGEKEAVQFFKDLIREYTIYTQESEETITNPVDIEKAIKDRYWQYSPNSYMVRIIYSA